MNLRQRLDELRALEQKATPIPWTHWQPLPAAPGREGCGREDEMKDPGAKSDLNTWVIVAPQGLCYVGLHKNEAETWSIALGWPDEAEIAEHKKDGWYAAQATITWRKP